MGGGQHRPPVAHTCTGDAHASLVLPRYIIRGHCLASHPPRQCGPLVKALRSGLILYGGACPVPRATVRASSQGPWLDLAWWRPVSCLWQEPDTFLLLVYNFLGSKRCLDHNRTAPPPAHTCTDDKHVTWLSKDIPARHWLACLPFATVQA